MESERAGNRKRVEKVYSSTQGKMERKLFGKKEKG